MNTIDDVEFLNNKIPIGTGAYSKVYKVKLKSDNNIYALKEINISKLTKSEKKCLKTEIKIHKELKHEFIIDFIDCIQVFYNVYILMEYAEYGNLLSFIDCDNGMPEELSLKYFYQTTKAIEYIHSKGIIHRDIKPENILITKDYKAKLCDFGYSIYEKDYETINEICGTFEYMAPEVILKSNYDRKIDSWGLGMLLFELNNGDALYKGNSLKEIKKSMLTKDLEFNKPITKYTKALIKKLLKFNPITRIYPEDIFILAEKENYNTNNLMYNNISEKDVTYMNKFIKDNNFKNNLLIEITTDRKDNTSFFNYEYSNNNFKNDKKLKKYNSINDFKKILITNNMPKTDEANKIIKNKKKIIYKLDQDGNKIKITETETINSICENEYNQIISNKENIVIRTYRKSCSYKK